jgi:hypothetical protein
MRISVKNIRKLLVYSKSENNSTGGKSYSPGDQMLVVALDKSDANLLILVTQEV